MDDFAKAFGTIWPVFPIGALALGAVFMLLKTSIARLATTLDQLRQEQEKLRTRLDEADRRIASSSEQQSLLAGRVERAEQTLEEALSTASAASQRHDGPDDEVLLCPLDSADRFNAAADALSLVAKELEGLDSRQAESWLRIKGDLDEQAFQLQRVQQHVDRLFAPPPAHLAIAPVSAAAD